MAEPVNIWKSFGYCWEDYVSPNAVESIGEVKFHHDVVGWHVGDDVNVNVNRIIYIAPFTIKSSGALQCSYTIVNSS
jgi:hypothetical protein